jgi:hypothetical protein
MRCIRLVGVLLAGMALCACSRAMPRDPFPDCDSDVGKAFRPVALKGVHIGMPKSALIALLGEPEYSPIEGQYYFALDGGDCRSETGQTVGCTLVAEFRAPGGTERVVTDSLQSCFWGAVSE